MSVYDGYPVLDTAGTTRIELWGEPLFQSSAWDASVWDGPDTWHGIGWQDATPLSVNAQITWGADDNAGAISFPAAGSWNVQTHDPNRILDPANVASPFAPYLIPGGAMRISYRETPDISHVVRVGFLDEIKFDMASKTGSIRATDGISLMVKAKLPAGLMHRADVPITLRAFARWVIAEGKVPFVTVEPNPTAYDPAIGLPLDEIASVWQHITTTAYDCLYAPWLDKDGVLRFRYFGAPEVTGVIIGGNQSQSIAIDSMETGLTLENVFNHLEALGDPLLQDAVWTAKDQLSIDTWGDLLLRRDRRNPFALYWCTQLLNDLGAASVKYNIGTIRPQHPSQFLNLLNLGMVSQINLRVDSHGTPINEQVNVLGGRIEANTESGWSAGLSTYQPAKPWTAEPKIEQFRIAANKSNEIILKAGANSHNSDSAQSQSYVGVSGELHHILIDFPAIDWTRVASISGARLIIYRPMHDDGDLQIAEEGHWKVQRITAAWDENTNWPGPAVTASDARSGFFESDVPQWYEIDITNIVARWAPVSISGGQGAVQHGVKIEPGFSTPRNPEHFFVSTRLSTDKPYLHIKYVPI